MAKLKLQPNPTFDATVAIPVPGDKSAPVLFTFKHRTRAELQKFMDASPGREDVDNILEMASGWDLADTFNRESVALLVENYITAPRVIFETYLDELVKAREKN